MAADTPGLTTAVLDVRPMLRGSENAVVESVLRRQAGVQQVQANPVAQTASVTYDANDTSLDQLRRVIQECGYHCAGQSVPSHLCDPAAEPGAGHRATDSAVAQPRGTTDGADQAHGGEDMHGGAQSNGPVLRSPHETMGHGGHGAMSMAAMVTDMRNRFLIAVGFAIPIVL